MRDHIINIHLSELLRTKTKKPKINEHKKKKFKIRIKKLTIYIFYLIIFLQDFLKS